MKRRIFISFILATFLLVACDNKDTTLIPDLLYSVKTTKGDGFVRLEREPDNQLSGVFYLSEGELIATKLHVTLAAGKELTLVDDTGKEIYISEFTPYKEPIFKDYYAQEYKDPHYSVNVDTGVVYGKAKGYWVSYPDSVKGNILKICTAKIPDLINGLSLQNLNMDVYLPEDGKRASRPLLVLIHGGAFFNGDKRDPGFPEWAHYFASRGYVVASVNYRLGFKVLNLGNLKSLLGDVKRAGFRAVQDVDAAIRFIVNKKDKYAVDPYRVFVAGTSAGGITALNAAFMKDENRPKEAKDEGGIHALNPEMNVSYNILAVGNMWGAVNDLKILRNNTSSVISFHSTTDPVVPFRNGQPFKKFEVVNLIFPEMFGSERITKYINNLNLRFKHHQTKLCRFDMPNKHTLHCNTETNELNEHWTEIADSMCTFFSEAMNPSLTLKHTESMQVFEVVSSEIDSIYWRVNGGVFLMPIDNQTTRVEVLLFPDASSHSVTVCGKYKSGLTFRHEWDDLR